MPFKIVPVFGLVSLVMAASGMAYAGDSITEDGAGFYNAYGCGTDSDMTLTLEPGILQFHETYCEIQHEIWNFPESELELECFSEGMSESRSLRLYVAGNGGIEVSSKDMATSVYFEFCG